MRRRAVLLALALVPLARADEEKTEVAVLGVIHGAHLKSKYSVETVIGTVRRYEPDVVFVEIPPHLYIQILARVDRKGFATRRSDVDDLQWIKAFPELYRGVLPLRKEMGYQIVPVSGWTPEASADRRAFWRGKAKDAPFSDRKRIHDAVREAFREIRAREGGYDDARFINSDHYADLFRLERTVWAACFDEGLGRGGEVAINRAHYGNIARALDVHRGKRVLVVYGAAHRYWFLRELRKRDDVRLFDVRAFLP